MTIPSTHHFFFVDLIELDRWVYPHPCQHSTFHTPQGWWYKYVPLETSNFVAIWYIIPWRCNASFSRTQGCFLANLLCAVMATCSCALLSGFMCTFCLCAVLTFFCLCSVLWVGACNLSSHSISNLLLCSVLWVRACNLSLFCIGNLLLCSVLTVCACNLFLFRIGDLLLYSVSRILTPS